MKNILLYLKSAIVLLALFAILIDASITVQGYENKYMALSQLGNATFIASDNKSPTVPEGLTIINKTYTTISLSWRESKDNIGVKGYQVYKDGKKIVSTSKTTYTNSNLIPGRKYTYSIKAYDAAGNESGNSIAINAETISDMQSPSVPGRLVAASSTYTSIELTWGASTDNTSIKGYEIYCDAKKIASTSATYYVRKKLIPGKIYAFFVKAYDIAGNYSVQSNSIWCATVPDKTVPSVPSEVKASAITETEAVLTWVSSTDNVEIKGYEIFKDGLKIGTASKTQFNIKNLIPGKSYTYFIRASDIAGNISGNSSPLKVTTLKDLKKPSAPTGLKVNSVNGSSVSLVWNASTDNVKVKGYRIYCNGVEVATSTRTSRIVKNPFRLGIGLFWVKAYDLSDNLSDSSNVVTAITP